VRRSFVGGVEGFADKLAAESGEGLGWDVALLQKVSFSFRM
jgi:hypothetical protein